MIPPPDVEEPEEEPEEEEEVKTSSLCIVFCVLCFVFCVLCIEYCMVLCIARLLYRILPDILIQLCTQTPTLGGWLHDRGRRST